MMWAGPMFQLNKEKIKELQKEINVKWTKIMKC